MELEEINESEIEEIVYNPDALIRIIDKISNNFTDIMHKYDPYHHGDPIAFFKTGHCNIFIEIMHGIFPNYTENVYVSMINGLYNHLISNLGEFCYDINGFVHPMDVEENYKCISYNDFEDLIDSKQIGNYKDFPREIIPELVTVGTNELHQIIKEHRQRKSRA